MNEALVSIVVVLWQRLLYPLGAPLVAISFIALAFACINPADAIFLVWSGLKKVWQFTKAFARPPAAR